jgi:hypothetical protein
MGVLGPKIDVLCLQDVQHTQNIMMKIVKVYLNNVILMVLDV